MIEKNHFHSKFHFNKERNNSSENGLVIRITKNMKVNIQELLLITDILISDYSGVFLDFIILDRPVIHFAYDYDYYRNIDTGLYYEIESFSAGPIAFTFKDVIHDLDKLLTGNDNFKDKRYRVRKEYMEYEIGQASKYICKKVLNI